MTRAITTVLILGYLLLVPFCFFGGMAMASMAMPGMSEMSGMEGHTHALAGCTAGAAIGCAHLADPHAPALGHGEMYLSLTETPLQSVVIPLLLFVIGIAVLWVDRVAIVRQVIRIAPLRAPRAYTRRDLFARLALFEASPNLA